jgi:dihydrofolate synthase/folylpolyglutamate synthase
VKSPEQILFEKVVELTSVEKFQGSTKESIQHFNSFHKQIREKFPSLKIITIAGTNGKGHVAYALEDLLQKKNYIVAKWSSPHLYSITERMSFCGNTIGVSMLDDIVEETKKIHEQYNFSFYEFLFSCFCSFVHQLKELDYLILEVGLGGRLDTTNMFDADVSALISVGLDHTEYLGNTLKEILLEKVEISREGKPHISSIGIEYLKKLENDFVTKRGGHYKNVYNAEFDYFQQNMQVASELFKTLLPAIKIDERELKDLYLGPGRMQREKYGTNDILLNGTHNPDGFKALTDYFYRESIKFDSVILGFSNRTEKELKQIIAIIKKYPCRFDKLYLTSFEHPRALSHSEAVRIAEINQIPFVNYSEFFDTIKAHDNALKVLVTGSNYFLSEVIRQLHI